MKQAALILAAILCFAACKTSVRDSGCITRYLGTGATSYLKPGQLDTIRQLFRTNNISTAGLEFTYYSSDTATDSGVFLLNQGVSAVPTINSLPVFFVSDYWYFRNGSFFPRYSGVVDYSYPGSDTSGHQPLAALRSLFFKEYDSVIYSSSA
ncbi:MAG TPA: hypothetical protein VKQ52_20355, partial [Puia sp.]|nr:hypothetical protein [Puia sp.]